MPKRFWPQDFHQCIVNELQPPAPDDNPLRFLPVLQMDPPFRYRRRRTASEDTLKALSMGE